MSLKLKPGGLPRTILIPASKSYANRALILACVHPSSLRLRYLPKADDVTFLISGLKQIGLEIKEEQGEIFFLNKFPACEELGARNSLSIDVGEGGTTARFLAALVAMGKRSYKMILGKRLSQRPWSEMIFQLRQLGVSAELKGQELWIQGPMQIPSALEINCQETTQVATAFQLALAFSKTQIIPKELTSSESYWRMTQGMINQLKTNTVFEIPLDWSSASYPLVFAALKHEIFFPKLQFDPLQADAKLYSILEEMNSLEKTQDGLIVRPGIKARNMTLDCSDCLDLVPALVFYLAHISGDHLLTGLENLAHKESDRLEELYQMLKRFKLKVHRTQDSLGLIGDENLHLEAMDLTLPEDHRLVMTAALFLRFHSGGTLAPAQAVSKSYPGFFDLMTIE